MKCPLFALGQKYTTESSTDVSSGVAIGRCAPICDDLHTFPSLDLRCLLSDNFRMLMRRILGLLLCTAAVPAAAQDGGALDARANGSWYDPAVPGQGLLLEVYSDPDWVFLTWFSFAHSAPPGRLAWWTADGPPLAGRVELQLHETTGGVFARPSVAQTEAVGAAVFTWLDCNHAVFDFVFDDGPSGRIELVRLTRTSSCTADTP